MNWEEHLNYQILNSNYYMKDSLEKYFDRLYPINRSLTGNGNRETLKILSEIIDLKIYEVPSGTNCFDWTIPSEWNVKEAWVKNSKGEKIIDFEKLNLHLLGYSEPYAGSLSLNELKQHLYSLPEQPELVPYFTSYYKKRWGFCITHTQFESLQEDEYEIFIDSALDENGTMTYGEAVMEGEQKDEILFSTYICHPSLANNELSGPLVVSHLYNELKKRKKLRYTYRFLFIPETIGSIYYLSVKGEELKKKLSAGFVVTCIGDAGIFTYKRSRKKNTLADRAAELVLKQTEPDYTILDFFPSGSDERQYCSPGFNLPIGSLMRTMYGKYAQYHTSADNKDFISFEAMEKSVEKYLKIIDVIENNYAYINKIPYCEPQLGKRGLYPTLGSQKTTTEFVESMMWLLNLADGKHDLIDIATISTIPIERFFDVAEKLKEQDILQVTAL
jgi:aminopeptidase-like protein